MRCLCRSNQRLQSLTTTAWPPMCCLSTKQLVNSPMFFQLPADFAVAKICFRTQVTQVGAGLSTKQLVNSPMFFQLPADFAVAKICFRTQVTQVGAGGLNLYFSATGATARQPGYSEAHMVSKTLQPGSNTLALVLPASFGGKWVKLESNSNTGDIQLQSVSIAPLN